MTTFSINKDLGQPGTFEKTVQTRNYRDEGEYFVFYADASRTKKVLTVRASIVQTIETNDEN